MVSLIGVLQHIETISTSKQSAVRKLFNRFFVSEFTYKYKFMNFNAGMNEQTMYNDANALLRQIAV